MKTLPFIVPENESNVRLARLLILIQFLGVSKRGKLLLSIEKLSTYDYLVRNPVLLQKILETVDQGKLMDLQEKEADSIESLFPNRASLYDYSTIKKITYSLIYNEYISVEHSKEGHIFYFATELGREFVEQLESTYFNRIKELSKVLIPLQKFSASQLQKILKSINYGVVI
ncbi:ABC-three component system middle component 4 [Paenibacillus polysaccharolyticus]|uniref:ABC-three component system middle component 4 n=1 Tax=Paenibacillus polysaccharolyticus TaxID=582692 RepID=UPI00280C1056|nr:ABC-three component system middle component 4 [Paenibacillus polysaccharolyticus]